ncbi:uncharacterized protein LOC131934968 [Physella acuta]|uniref:uncharacterized protein LOC131934968 n=1 Tax=Physella acuta TaxID=109671 RepID=UPI0027DB6041|nr:uncharacterized protein LOC131934968 [Physella acuta]
MDSKKCRRRSLRNLRRSSNFFIPVKAVLENQYDSEDVIAVESAYGSAWLGENVDHSKHTSTFADYEFVLSDQGVPTTSSNTPECCRTPESLSAVADAPSLNVSSVIIADSNYPSLVDEDTQLIEDAEDGKNTASFLATSCNLEPNEVVKTKSAVVTLPHSSTKPSSTGEYVKKKQRLQDTRIYRNSKSGLKQNKPSSFNKGALPLDKKTKPVLQLPKPYPKTNVDKRTPQKSFPSHKVNERAHQSLDVSCCSKSNQETPNKTSARNTSDVQSKHLKSVIEQLSSKLQALQTSRGLGLERKLENKNRIGEPILPLKIRRKSGTPGSEQKREKMTPNSDKSLKARQRRSLSLKKSVPNIEVACGADVDKVLPKKTSLDFDKLLESDVLDPSTHETLGNGGTTGVAVYDEPDFMPENISVVENFGDEFCVSDHNKDIELNLEKLNSLNGCDLEITEDLIKSLGLPNLASNDLPVADKMEHKTDFSTPGKQSKRKSLRRSSRFFSPHEMPLSFALEQSPEIDDHLTLSSVSPLKTSGLVNKSFSISQADIYNTYFDLENKENMLDNCNDQCTENDQELENCPKNMTDNQSNMYVLNEMIDDFKSLSTADVTINVPVKGKNKRRSSSTHTIGGDNEECSAAKSSPKLENNLNISEEDAESPHELPIVDMETEVSGDLVSDTAEEMDTSDTGNRVLKSLRNRKSWGFPQTSKPVNNVKITRNNKDKNSSESCDGKSSTQEPKSDSIDISPALVDLYRNKNFVQPKPKVWETIKENPPNHLAVFTKKKFRRSLVFKDNATTAKLQRRHKKAVELSQGTERVPISDDEFMRKFLDIQLMLD